MADILYVAPVPENEVRTLVNPPSNAGAVMPTGIATTVIAGVVVLLRLFTRVKVVEGVLGADDYLAVCALAFSIAFLAVGKHLFTVGAGLHMWDVPMSDYSPAFLQTTVGATLTYAISISFAKMSVLAFYLRISPDQNFRRAVYALLGIVIAYTLTYILLMIFRCEPVAYNWDLTLEGKCIDSLIPMMTLSVANILLDTVVLLLPVKVVLPLQIPRRQKVSLVMLFTTGGFVIGAAIKRTVIMPPLLASADYTWELPEQFVWSFIEVNAGIVCVSVPALKPFCMRYLPFLIVSRLRSSQERSKDRFGYENNPSDNPSKHRRGVYSQSYELPSRDDLPAEERSNDDEARLWSKQKPISIHVAQMKKDSDSIHSLTDQFPGRLGPASAVSSSGFGAHEYGNPGGIKVTKETTVAFD